MRQGLCILFLVLTACSTHQPTNGTSIDDMSVVLHQGTRENQLLGQGPRNRPPSEVSKALMPDIKMRVPYPRLQQRRFDVAVQNVPARTFYMGLVADTQISIVVSPEIVGKITLNLKQVTIEQVLQTLENVYGYAYNPMPGGYEILPNTLKTKIYTVNYLELERKGRSSMRLSSGEVNQYGPNPSSGTGTSGTSNASFSGTAGVPITEAGTIGQVETKSTINFWKELQTTLEHVVGHEEGRSVTVNPIAGVVVVHATPKELKQIDHYLDLVQNNMDRQVILEVKILEVILNDQFQMGIDWKIFGARLNALSNFPEAHIEKIEFPDAFKIGIKWIPQDFTTTIQALETQGNVQVLSSPRVSTMNNQKSAIKVGSDSFYVTNVTSTNNVVTTSAISNPTQNVNLTPFFSGITLDVTPQIDAQGGVTLHVHPAVSLVTDQRKIIDLGNQGGVLNLPLAYSTVRESDTIVHAKNGQVVIIGGLMQNQTDEDIAELPFFGNVPFMGTLFRMTKQTSKKSELVILIKPTVMNPKTVNEDLVHTTERVASLKRGFHVGGRPDIYGTEGEVPVSLGPSGGKYGQQRPPRD